VNTGQKGNDGCEFYERETVVRSARKESRSLVVFVYWPTDDG